MELHDTDDGHSYVGRCQTPVAHTGQGHVEFHGTDDDTIMSAGGRLRWHTQVRYTLE